MIGWLNTNAGAVQAITTGILVAITAYYAWATRSISRENQAMARATEAMVEEARQQRLLSVYPRICIVAIGSQSVEGQGYGAWQSNLLVSAINAGVGRALGVQFYVEHAVLHYGLASIDQKTVSGVPNAGITLGQDEPVDIVFVTTNREVLDLGQPELGPGFLRASCRDIYGRAVETKVPLSFRLTQRTLQVTVGEQEFSSAVA